MESARLERADAEMRGSFNRNNETLTEEQAIEELSNCNDLDELIYNLHKINDAGIESITNTDGTELTIEDLIVEVNNARGYPEAVSESSNIHALKQTLRDRGLAKTGVDKAIINWMEKVWAGDTGRKENELNDYRVSNEFSAVKDVKSFEKALDNLEKLGWTGTNGYSLDDLRRAISDNVGIVEGLLPLGAGSPKEIADKIIHTDFAVPEAYGIADAYARAIYKELED